MKLSVYTGLAIGPLMMGVCFVLVQQLNADNPTLTANRELTLMVAAGFGVYGLYRLVRSIVALVNRNNDSNY